MAKRKPRHESDQARLSRELRGYLVFGPCPGPDRYARNAIALAREDGVAPDCPEVAVLVAYHEHQGGPRSLDYRCKNGHRLSINTRPGPLNQKAQTFQVEVGDGD